MSDNKTTPPLCKDAPPVSLEITEQYINAHFDKIHDLIKAGRPLDALNVFQIFVTEAVNTAGLMMAQGVAEKLGALEKATAHEGPKTARPMIQEMYSNYENIAATNRDNLAFLEEQKQKL